MHIESRLKARLSTVKFSKTGKDLLRFCTELLMPLEYTNKCDAPMILYSR